MSGRTAPPGRDRGSEIVPRDQGNVAMAQCRDQPERIPDRIQDTKRAEVAIIIRVPTRRAPIAPLVGRDDAETGSRERQHHLSPGIGQLGEAVQQQHQRAVSLLEAGLKDMHPQPIDVAHEARSDPGWKRAILQRRQLGHSPP